MVRFQLILTRLPSLPAHELAARLHHMPPELNRGILTNAMWRGSLPDVAIGWSEHEAPMRAALARIVELGGEGYIESQPTGVHRLLAMLRGWRAARRVQPGGKPRKPVPASPTPAGPVGEPRMMETGRAWWGALARLAEASARFAFLFVVSALVFLGLTDPGMIQDPLPRLASRRVDLLALLVGLLAAQACVFGLRRSFAGGSGVWRARLLVLLLASSAVLAAVQAAPSTDGRLAGRASGASIDADIRAARASRGSAARSTQPSSGLDEASPAATPSAAATTRTHGPMSEREFLALCAKVVSQMAGPAPDPLRRVGGGNESSHRRPERHGSRQTLPSHAR